MLTRLRLKNIALLNNQNLLFQKGFTVITGETGSGKSIFLECLDLLLGGSQNSNYYQFHNGEANYFSIEGEFSKNSTLNYWFSKNKIICNDTQFFVSRNWSVKDGRLKSKSTINGVLINKSQLFELRQILIEFTSQGYSYKIQSSSYQLECLDRFGSNSLETALFEVKNSWMKWQKSFQELTKFNIEYQKLQSKNFEIKELLEELESFNLEDPNEYNNLKNEQDRLANIVELQSFAENILSRLKYGNDEFPSTLDQLGEASYELKSMIKIESSLEKNYDDISNIYNSLKDLIYSLDQYTYLLESDPKRLSDVQERLESLRRLQERNGLNLQELINKRNELRDSYADLSTDRVLIELQEKEIEARKERDINNRNLSNIRHKVAIKFEEKLIQTLYPLGLSNVRFEVKFNISEPSENGIDSMEFLFSANPGQDLSPLTEIASGGEMSRFLLALKIVLASTDHPRILIFDEIDAGVSGRISKEIAHLLRKLSLGTQVFCVTHQPLVAASADNHIVVNKFVKNGQTSSKIKFLEGFEERQNELAELAGGDMNEAKLYAASLLEQEAA